MVGRADILRNLSKVRQLSSVVRRDFTAGRIYFNKPQGASQSASSSGNVPGLTEAVYKRANEPVGPGASKSSKDYQNPEYFCYHKMSYFEAEIEMAQYRLPQPSSKN